MPSISIENISILSALFILLCCLFYNYLFAPLFEKILGPLIIHKIKKFIYHKRPYSDGERQQSFRHGLVQILDCLDECQNAINPLEGIIRVESKELIDSLSKCRELLRKTSKMCIEYKMVWHYNEVIGLMQIWNDRIALIAYNILNIRIICKNAHPIQDKMADGAHKFSRLLWFRKFFKLAIRYIIIAVFVLACGLMLFSATPYSSLIPLLPDLRLIFGGAVVLIAFIIPFAIYMREERKIRRTSEELEYLSQNLDDCEEEPVLESTETTNDNKNDASECQDSSDGNVRVEIYYEEETDSPFNSPSVEDQIKIEDAFTENEMNFSTSDNKSESRQSPDEISWKNFEVELETFHKRVVELLAIL